MTGNNLHNIVYRAMKVKVAKLADSRAMKKGARISVTPLQVPQRGLL